MAPRIKLTCLPTLCRTEVSETSRLIYSVRSNWRGIMAACGMASCRRKKMRWFGGLDADGRPQPIRRMVDALAQCADCTNEVMVIDWGWAISPLWWRAPLDAEVHGLDAHYTSASGLLNADLQFVRSDKRGTTGDGAIFDVRYAPSSRYQHKLELERFDDTVDINDMGFLSRNNYRGSQYIFSYAFPKPSSWYRARVAR